VAARVLARHGHVVIVLYHGILAPRARARARVVAHGAVAPSPGEHLPTATEEPGSDPSPPAADVSSTAPAEHPGDAKANPPEKARDWKWADLMRRVFDLDVLACPRCGGRMSVIATIEAVDVLRKILSHLGLPTDPPAPLPARTLPSLPFLSHDRTGPVRRRRSLHPV